jgi:hypothetical protein
VLGILKHISDLLPLLLLNLSNLHALSHAATALRLNGFFGLRTLRIEERLAGDWLAIGWWLILHDRKKRHGHIRGFL